MLDFGTMVQNSTILGNYVIQKGEAVTIKQVGLLFKLNKILILRIAYGPCLDIHIDFHELAECL